MSLDDQSNLRDIFMIIKRGFKKPATKLLPFYVVLWKLSLNELFLISHLF